MSSCSVLCGSCEYFKPAQNRMFFNCTYASHAGIQYGMQVRKDTVSCDAFSSNHLPNPKPNTGPTQLQPRFEPPDDGTCTWGRVILIVTIIIIILLLAWGVYACAKAPGETSLNPTPTPVPTVTPRPTPTGIPTTSPPPTPLPIFYYQIGDWVKSSYAVVNVTSVERTESYFTPGPVFAPAGTSFIFVSLTVFNISTSAISVQATDLALVDSSGIRYMPRELAKSFYDSFPFAAKIVQPGSTVSGKILYVVPDVSPGLEIRTVLNGYEVGWILSY